MAETTEMSLTLKVAGNPSEAALTVLSWMPEFNAADGIEFVSLTAYETTKEN